MNRISHLCIAIILFFVIIVSASAQAQGLGEERLRAERRMDRWVSSFAAFAEKHQDLTWEQRDVIWSAIYLVKEEAFVSATGRERWVEGEGAVVENLVQRMRQHFTINQQGEIFSGMGPTQVWLSRISFAMAAPFCNCWSLHASCTMAGGGPTGSCETGCQSWSGSGVDYVGICGAAS